MKKAWRKEVIQRLTAEHGKRIITRRVRLRWSPERGWELNVRPSVRTWKIIHSSTVLDVPQDIRVCPHCSAPLTVRFEDWTLWRKGFWRAGSPVVECTSEPDIESDEYDDWAAIHSQMPYVYWLPVCQRVEKWVNDNYCFDLDREHATP